MMAKIHRTMSKTVTSKNGEAGPRESYIGPPTELKLRAHIPMKNVSKIDMAPRTSLGKFFCKRDSSAITCMMEKRIINETRA